jgi:hypothetical protein
MSSYHSDDKSDDDSDDDGGRGGVPFVGAYVTKPPVTKPPVTKPPVNEEPVNEELDIEDKKLMVFFNSGPNKLDLRPEYMNPVIDKLMLKYSDQFEPSDSYEEKLDKIILAQTKEKESKKGGKRQKSKRYRKSKKQRKNKTKTKRRVRRSTRLKYK